MNVNWLLIGLSEVAREENLAAFAIESQRTLYAVASRVFAKGRRHAPRTWRQLDEAVKDPGVDAVHLSAPVYLHARLALVAL